MFKSVLREICLMILLTTAIVLVLGVAFYDYFPKNSAKVIPSKIAYNAPEDIKKELAAAVENNTIQQVIKTYTVEESDLKLYEKTDRYENGKINPFAPAEANETNVVINNTSKPGNISNKQNTINKNTNSTDTFFNTAGK